MEGNRGKCIQGLIRQNWRLYSIGLAVTATRDCSEQPGCRQSQGAVHQKAVVAVFSLKHLKDPQGPFIGEIAPSFLF